MKPYVSGERDTSLQNPGADSYKDLYPPLNTELYYAVTMVDGEGQEEKAVEAKKVQANHAVLTETIPKVIRPWFSLLEK